MLLSRLCSLRGSNNLLSDLRYHRFADQNDSSDLLRFRVMDEDRQNSLFKRDECVQNLYKFVHVFFLLLSAVNDYRRVHFHLLRPTKRCQNFVLGIFVEKNGPIVGYAAIFAASAVLRLFPAIFLLPISPNFAFARDFRSLNCVGVNSISLHICA